MNMIPAVLLTVAAGICSAAEIDWRNPNVSLADIVKEAGIGLGSKPAIQPRPADETSIMRCDLTEASFGEKVEKIKINGWTAFLIKTDAVEGPNGFQVCLNGHQTIYVPGIPNGEEAIRVMGEYLAIDTVDPSRVVPTKDIPGGKQMGDAFIAKNGTPYILTGRSVYILYPQNLTPDWLKGGTAYIERMPSIRYRYAFAAKPD